MTVSANTILIKRYHVNKKINSSFYLQTNLRYDIICLGDNMKIESIKKVGNKYKIEFENNSKVITYDDVIINNGLLFNREVDEKVLNKLNIDNNYYDVYYKTINYITRKLRSEKEVCEFIDKFNVNEKDKEEIILKLKSIGFIDDDNFAKAYISDRIHLSSDGPFKIKRELLDHNISEEKIDLYLSKVDEEVVFNKINKLIGKKLKNTKYTGFNLKQKTIEYLINLGFDKDECSNIFDTFKVDNKDLLKKEFDKAYKKLSLKYKDLELKNKIKQKLYQKGFNSEEINSMFKV